MYRDNGVNVELKDAKANNTVPHKTEMGTDSSTRSVPRPSAVQSPERKKIGPPVKPDSTQATPTVRKRVPRPVPVQSIASDTVDDKPTVSEVTVQETVLVAEKKMPEDAVRVEGLRTVIRVPSGESFHASDDSLDTARGLTVGKVVRRSLLCVFTALLLAVTTVFGACYTVATGPSESVRNILVLSALQASATKWVPGLFLDDAVVEQILEDSKKVNTDVISVEDYQNSQNDEGTTDKWANAIDGMIYEPVSGPTFKGYVLLVKDPSRVFVGVATDKFTDDTPGLRIFDMAEKYGAVAAINGGEYPDAGGMGIGGRPIGLTYSEGECVWNDGLRRSFMGFDENNRLVVREGLTYAQAEELGIRDGVCFQTGKTLITNEDGNVTLYYADNDTGTAQRTAIGQAADGTVILLVTDGRTASSLGATKNDVIDVMVSYGAISAGMLDGGSSSLMYYKDFYDKYGLDKSGLDEYQRMGLINKYKAFTTPRRLPTCFIVAPE